jgi:hypothetical protein
MENAFEATDLLRLNDLARQRALGFVQDGNAYRFNGFTAQGLTQALAFAEGFDRGAYGLHRLELSNGRMVLYVPGAVPSRKPVGSREERDLHRLTALIKQHGISLSRDEMPDFNAHTLKQALGFVEGFHRARA